MTIWSGKKQFLPRLGCQDLGYCTDTKDWYKGSKQGNRFVGVEYAIKMIQKELAIPVKIDCGGF